MASPKPRRKKTPRRRKKRQAKSVAKKRLDSRKRKPAPKRKRKPAPKRKPRIQSKGLRGRLEGAVVSPGGRRGRIGWVIWSDGRVSRRYEAYYFLARAKPKEPAIAEIDRWLGPYEATRGKMPERGAGIVKRAVAWFDRTGPKDYPEPVYVRFGVWLRHPETKQYRKAFDAVASEVESLTADAILDVVPTYYLDEGYNIAGVELYFFSLQRPRQKDDRIPKNTPQRRQSSGAAPAGKRKTKRRKTIRHNRR